MQKHLIKQVIGGAVVTLVALNSAHAGIANTKHNLSSSGSYSVKAEAFGSGGTTEICLFCHTPHMTEAKSDAIPLWNHTISSAGLYGVYTSGSFNGGSTIQDVGDGVTDPSNATVTNLCLSCHDGTVAINSLYNASNLNGNVNPVMLATGLTGTGMLLGSNPANLGTDLTNDHPVNFTYQSSIDDGDPDLHGINTLSPVRLYNGKVQCASCHDPHIDYSTAGDTAKQPFLRVAITGSALCLKCHDK